MIRYKEIDYNIAPICRIFMSGSSSAGKTHLTYKLLQDKLFKFSRVIYYHPDIHNKSPVEWDLPVPLFFQPGLPSKEDILELPPRTCLILDDLFQSASDSPDIDYLFRVLSSKRELHVIIMTQRYFAQGRYSVSIRNSSNYHVLMRNADATVNPQAARKMGLITECAKAADINRSKPYPYIFIDRTAEARVHGVAVFVELFARKEVIIKNMRYYLFTESDFNATFKRTEENIAVRHGNQEKTQEKSTIHVGKSTKTPNTSSTKQQINRETNNIHSHYARRRQIKREVSKALQRYKKRAKL